MNEKVGIATVYTGFNYGSSLQAYALKTYLSDMGYQAEILGQKGSIIKGRDVRLNKLITIFLRTFRRPELFKNTLLTYRNSINRKISESSKKLFMDFEIRYLNVKKLSRSNLKKYAYDPETIACFCGSDQIWNAASVYIDSFYFLRFVPKDKRVAYAPSLGNKSIPDYNLKIMRKYINDIKYLSVREDHGADILLNIINRDVPVHIDPTLLFSPERWLISVKDENKIKNKYVLLYFLDTPTPAAIHYIKIIAEKLQLKLIAVQYKYEELSIFFDITYLDAGPIEFVTLVNNASFICTDSFHGTAFSVNFNIPFYTFERNYKSAANQSSRIISLLKKTELFDRFIDTADTDTNEINTSVNFNNSNHVLVIERQKSRDYLENALKSIQTVKQNQCGIKNTIKKIKSEIL